LATNKIFNTSLKYFCAYFILKSGEKSSLTGDF